MPKNHYQHYSYFQRYWRRLSPEKKRQLAKNSGTTNEYLQQIACGYSKPSIKLTKLICAESGLKRFKMRPDIWGRNHAA